MAALRFTSILCGLTLGARLTLAPSTVIIGKVPTSLRKYSDGKIYSASASEDTGRWSCIHRVPFVGTYFVALNLLNSLSVVL